MKQYVVDAGVALKWFLPETHTAAAVRLLDDSMQLSAPDLIISEIGHALGRKVRENEISDTDADEILEAFDSVPLELCPSAQLLPAAIAMAAGIERSVFDTLYLSLAVAHDSILVTADRNLYSAVSNSEFREHIRWIEEEL